MINKNRATKSIFNYLSKFLIVFLLIMGYFIVNKVTAYAAAYPGKEKGEYKLYFTDADGTEYGYKVDINFGAGFISHNVARAVDGGSVWAASNITCTVTTILGNDSKKPIIWFDCVGNDEPGDTGHYRNFTMRCWFPRTVGASTIGFVKMTDTRFVHSFTDESTATDITSKLYRTGTIFSLQEVGIQIYGDDSSDNGYDMTTTSNIAVYMKSIYDQEILDLNSSLNGNWNGSLGSWGTADVWVNDVQVANDVTDFYQSFSYGSKYTINDIKAKDGYVYTGAASYSGTIISSTSVTPPFSTPVSFDLNSTLDGTVYWGMGTWGTADVWFNGVKVAEDVTDYYSASIGKDSTYLVNDIKTNAGYLYTGEASYSGIITVSGSLFPPFSTLVTFDLNSYLDGVLYAALGSWGTADVWINGVQVADDIGDWWSNTIPKGSMYEINDIKAKYGYAYVGNVSYSGTLTDTYTSIAPAFELDNCPVITGKDRYYTLDDAINGKITETDLIKNVTVTDDRDNNLKLLLKVTDYNANEFTQFTSDGSTLIKYQVTDSGGNTAYATNTVYIVDTTSVVVQDNSYVRFINADVYTKSFEEGGLETDSIWKTNSDYAETLTAAMDNRNSLREEKGSINLLGINYSYTKPGSISQEYIYQSWTLTPEDVNQVKEYINTNGFGNIKGTNALSNFVTQFNHCIN